jgi:hypothetical protein
VDHVTACCFKPARFEQNIECGLDFDPLHPAGKFHLVLFELAKAKREPNGSLSSRRSESTLEL